MNLKFLVPIMLIAFLASCGGDDNKPKTTTSNTPKKEVKKEEVKPAETTNADPMSNKGIGPVSSITLGDLDAKLVEKGHEVYKEKGCTACHKFKKRLVGPPLQGVITRRSPEWIMNMILNPEEMVEKDPIARKLLEEYSAPMANQNLTEEEARSILEYFRTKE